MARACTQQLLAGSAPPVLRLLSVLPVQRREPYAGRVPGPRPPQESHTTLPRRPRAPGEEEKPRGNKIPLCAVIMLPVPENNQHRASHESGFVPNSVRANSGARGWVLFPLVRSASAPCPGNRI